MIYTIIGSRCVQVQDMSVIIAKGFANRRKVPADCCLGYTRRTGDINYTSLRAGSFPAPHLNLVFKYIEVIAQRRKHKAAKQRKII